MYLGRVVELGPVEDDLRRAAASLHAGAARLAAVDGSRRTASRSRRSPAIRRTRSIRRRAAASTRAARSPRRCAREQSPELGRLARAQFACRRLPHAGPASGHSRSLGGCADRWTGALVEVRDLTVRFVTREATVHAVNGVSFTRPPRRGAVHPRRIRLRQERDPARADAPAAAAPHADRGRDPHRRRRTCWRCSASAVCATCAAVWCR